MKTNLRSKLLFTCFTCILAFSGLKAQNTLTYTDSFRTNVASTAAQKTTWDNFRATLTPHCWNQLTMKGTFNAAGITTNDQATITSVANALMAGTAGTFTFGANTWRIGTGCAAGSIELTVNTAVCGCAAGYSIRPGQLSTAWGGVNTSLCNGPNQRITLVFGYATTPTAITGPSPVCAYTTQNYSCTAVAGAVGYTWTVPAGATIVSGQGTTNISVTFGNTAGNVSVAATGACGIYAPVNKAVAMNQLPVLTFPPLNPICESAAPFTLNTATPPGGTYSGNGVIGNSFDPQQAGAGSHIITYTYTDNNSCTNTITQSINVNSAPNVTLQNIPSVCVSVSPYTISQGMPIGGTYSGPGVSNNIFDPSAVGVGTHNITYTFTNGNGCTDSATATINVTALPTVTQAAFNSVCLNGNPVMLSGGSPAGGYYAGTGVNVNYFYPMTAGVGTHTISYIYNDGNGCSDTAMQTITVNPLPTVTFANPSVICLNASPVTLTGGAPAGGTYSGPGVNNGMFDPMAAGVGSHTLWYTYNNGTCSNTDTATIVVQNLPGVTLQSFAGVHCSNDPAFALSGGMPAGGTYSGTGVNNGMFDPSVAGTGFHTITYTYSDNNNCSNSASQVIQVNAAPNVTIPATDNVCVTVPAYPLAGGSPAGGSYSGNGVNNGMFDPAAAGVGTHPVTYTYTDPLGCSGSANMIITVNACTGVQEAEFVNHINVYPNPNDGIFTIETTVAQNTTLNIVMTNMLGDVVKTIENSEFQGTYKKQVDMNEMPAGIYFVMVKAGSEMQVKRIVKN